ncbi:MAG: hypothetical protein AB1656_27350 [Candidatus Omnitrophota bacterium]
MVKMKEVLIDSGEPRIGMVQTKALLMKAKPVPGKAVFGIFGERVVQLPAKRFLQFQGGAEILVGARDGVDLHLQVETRKDRSSAWVVEEAFPAQGLNPDKAEHPGSCFFKEDLSAYAGQEVRLSIVLRADPAYSKVGGVEKWNPGEISVQWFMAELISTSFRVILGGDVPVDVDPIDLPMQGKKQSRNDEDNVETQDIAWINGSLQTVIVGDMDGSDSDDYGYVANPSDFPICSEYVPATYGSDYNRYVCYFSAARSYGHTDHGAAGNPARAEDAVYGASSRVINFADSSTPDNMYIASQTSIKNHIKKNANNEAVAVLSPSGDASRNFDDHWAGISSVIYNPLSDNQTDALHAFYYVEDHFQYNSDLVCDDYHTGSNIPRGATCEHNYDHCYTAIGYARSKETDGSASYGLSFSKLHDNNNNYQIIKYELPESSIEMNYKHLYGCGDPSVVPFGDYYYMIFNTFSIQENINGDKQLYLYHPDSDPDPDVDNSYYSWVDSCTGTLEQKHGNCGHFAYTMLSAARALKSSVHSTNYESNANPWYKYNNVTSNYWESQNWTQAGNGGEFSAVWNAKSGNPDQPNDLSKYCLNPKFSSNNYLNDADFIIIGKGQNTAGIPAFYLHTSYDPINWNSTAYMIMTAESKTATKEEYFYYPSLIGSNGKDYATTEYNMLYYTRKTKELINNQWTDTGYDLVRKTFQLQNY